MGYDLTRFEHPVTISTGLDPTLKSSSCDAAWFGPSKGCWALSCIKGHPRVARDLSSLGLVYRQESIDYIKAHLADVPGVLLAREGRTWGWYRPDQIPNLDNIADGRPKVPARIGLWTLWVLEATSIVGAVALRRRRVTISPLVALVITVTITTARSGRRDIGRRRSRLSCSWPWPEWAGRGSRFGARSGVAPLRRGNPCRRCRRPWFVSGRWWLHRMSDSGACSPAPKFGGVFDPVSCMLVCLFGERGLRCLGRSRPARLVIGSDAAACGFCPFRVGVSIGPREFGCFCPHGAYTLVVYDRCFLAVR